MDREKQLINELNELVDDWCIKNDFDNLDDYLMYDDEIGYSENPLMKLHSLIECELFDKEYCEIDTSLEEVILKAIDALEEEQGLQRLGVSQKDLDDHQQSLYEYQNGGI